MGKVSTSCWGLFLLMVIFSCKNDIQTLSYFKSNFYEFKEKPIHWGDTFEVKFDSHEDEIDSIVLTLNGKRIENKSTIDSTNSTLGLNRIEMKVFHAGDYIYSDTQLPVLSSFKETPIDFEIVAQYPHSKTLFTEGIFYKNNQIIESSGNYKNSFIASYALGSREFKIKKDLEDRIFAEGITELDDKLYLLTYKEHQILVLDPVNFERIETLKMPDEMQEGWGLTTDGENFITSDGTQHIYFFDKNFQLKKKIQVVGYISIYTQINELEFVGNKLYANVWKTNYILEINPESGAVERYFDLTSLNKKSQTEDVLNGIAYKNENFLVTGKYWDTLYEIHPKN